MAAEYGSVRFELNNLRHDIGLYVMSKYRIGGEILVDGLYLSEQTNKVLRYFIKNIETVNNQAEVDNVSLE